MMDTSCLTHPRAITVIKDPIHDNIRVTCFEREVIDSPYFQRLHFVLQNSTTYIAFPSNKNTRFSHSLGVSHLCGEMLVKALANASSIDLDQFLSDGAKFIKDNILKPAEDSALDELRAGWKQTISGQSQFRHSPFLFPAEAANTETAKAQVRANASLDPEVLKDPGRPLDLEKRYEDMTAGFLVDLLWQTLRLCGLVHDIGHLPMSHSLEGAIKRLRRRQREDAAAEASEGTDVPTDLAEGSADIDAFDPVGDHDYITVIDNYDPYFRAVFGDLYSKTEFKRVLKGFPLHEKRGLFVLELLFKDGLFQFEPGPARDYRRVIYRFAMIILFSSIVSEEEEAFAKDGTLPSFFRVMKSIVAGAVDGDRMDYVIRDGHASGSTIGQFDIKKLVDNAILFRGTERENNPYRIGFFYRGLSGLEQFFVQRHQGYKYLIYHRTSSRSEGCLQELMARLFKLAAEEPNHAVAQILVEFGYLAEHETADGDGGGEPFSIFPTSKTHLQTLDDASLRTMLMRIKLLLDDTLHSDKANYGLAHYRLSKAEFTALEPVHQLLKIVLFRDFRHIYDPFKHVSISQRIRNILGDQFDQNDFGLVIQSLKNEKIREEYFAEAEHLIEDRFDGRLSLVLGVQMPKIFDAERAEGTDQDVFVLFNGRDTRGEIVADRAANRSNALRFMSELSSREFKINCYLVGIGIKADAAIRTQVNQVLDEFLADAYWRVLKGHRADSLPSDPDASEVEGT